MQPIDIGIQQEKAGPHGNTGKGEKVGQLIDIAMEYRRGGTITCIKSIKPKCNASIQGKTRRNICSWMGRVGTQCGQVHNGWAPPRSPISKLRSEAGRSSATQCHCSHPPCIRVLVSIVSGFVLCECVYVKTSVLNGGLFFRVVLFCFVWLVLGFSCMQHASLPTCVCSGVVFPFFVCAWICARISASCARMYVCVRVFVRMFVCVVVCSCLRPCVCEYL